MRKTENNAKHCCRLKTFPDGSWEIMAASRNVFLEDGFELAVDFTTHHFRDAAKMVDSLSCDTDRARRRAAARVHDYAMCNDFKYFVTLTLNKEKIDRYDVKKVVQTMNRWLDNRVRRNGLKYVLVPELHADGAVHFHGFFNDALCAVDSGTISCSGDKKPHRPKNLDEKLKWLSDGGHIVYNLPDWTYGFTTAIELYGSYAASIGYVCKYIRKQSEKIGGRWVYCGGDLKKPVVSYPDISLRDVEKWPGAYRFTVDAAGLQFVVCRGGGSDDNNV